MATLSTKVSAKVAETFELMADEAGQSTSAALRELVEMAVRYRRRLEVLDPEIGPPLGIMFLEEADE